MKENVEMTLPQGESVIIVYVVGIMQEIAQKKEEGQIQEEDIIVEEDIEVDQEVIIIEEDIQVKKF